MATLTTTITESWTSDYGQTFTGSTTDTFEDIDSYERRIIGLNRDKETIADLSADGAAATAGAPAYDFDDVKYMRFRNLMTTSDTYNGLILNFGTSESTPTYYMVYLAPEQVFYFKSVKSFIGQDAGSLGSIVKIYASSAHSSTLGANNPKLELFIAFAD